MTEPSKDEEVEQSWGEYLRLTLYELLHPGASKLNALLVFVPLAIGAKVYLEPNHNLFATNTIKDGGSMLFWLTLPALCVLAERLGYVTEQLALHVQGRPQPRPSLPGGEVAGDRHFQRG